MMSPIFTVTIVFIFLLMAGLYKNLKKPVSTALFTSASGTAGLIAVNLLGIELAVNFYTLAFSCLMGIPGVICMLVLKLLLK